MEEIWGGWKVWIQSVDCMAEIAAVSASANELANTADYCGICQYSEIGALVERQKQRADFHPQFGDR